jgi:hypothetical protein
MMSDSRSIPPLIQPTSLSSKFFRILALLPSIVALPFVHKPYLPPAKHCLTEDFPAHDLDISERASYILSSRLSGAARIAPDHMLIMRHNY